MKGKGSAKTANDVAKTANDVVAKTANDVAKTANDSRILQVLRTGMWLVDGIS